MVPRLSHFLAAAFVLLIVAPRPAEAIPVLDQSDGAIDYRIESLTDANRNLASRFGGPELALLEKLNRTDLKHLPRLQQLIVPSAWRLELDYSPFPATYPAAKTAPKILVVDQPSQAFAAYEYGQQVYWGPVSSGRQARPTPSGLYHLNWRARSRTSTLSGEWRLNWYFNFHNARGLAFHEFDLPGVPQSHACVRLLSRDAAWIFQWGEGWKLDTKGQIETRGTPVLILGSYAFGSPAPWQAAEYWTRTIALPEVLPIQ
jgi:lipoprotein-anchoring transpeptidase ErfK/SrfK